MRKWFDPSRYQLYVSGLLLIMVSANWFIPPAKLQTQSMQWSIPAPIPGLSLENYPPMLVADHNRTVHAFSSQWMGDSENSVRAVVYSQWTLEYGWSSPIDILVSPVGEARITSAYLDKKDVMHVLFYGGNGETGDIYYSSAYATGLDSSTSWSAPIVVGEAAGDPEGAVLVGDGYDQLSVIYHGNRDGYGVYVVNSQDGGATWSNSRPIFLSDGDAPYVYSLRAIESDSGWIHAVWNTYSKAGQGRGIYYSGTKLGDTQWSDPILLAGAQEGLGTQTPAIIEYQGVLFALYNLTPKITMRRSVDNGLTWDDPIVLFARHVGVNGALSLVIDSNDEMHLFFGQRITGTKGASDTHGMWHSAWLNGRWVEPDAVIKGPRVGDTEGTTGFDPYEADAIVSQGNVLLVTWRTDPGGIKDNGVWYSYTVLDAPEEPLATLQAQNLPQDILPTATVAAPVVEVSPTAPVDIDRDRPGQNPLVGIVIGLMILGFLWILFVILTRH